MKESRATAREKKSEHNNNDDDDDGNTKCPGSKRNNATPLANTDNSDSRRDCGRQGREFLLACWRSPGNKKTPYAPGSPFSFSSFAAPTAGEASLIDLESRCKHLVHADALEHISSDG